VTEHGVSVKNTGDKFSTTRTSVELSGMDALIFYENVKHRKYKGKKIFINTVYGVI